MSNESSHPVRPADWWQDAVIYQVYPASFADSNGTGLGDLKGIQSHLGDLKTLGVDAVWLSPFYPSPQNDAGYDVSDYTDVDPSFGMLADAGELMATAASHAGLLDSFSHAARATGLPIMVSNSIGVKRPNAA